MSFRFRRTIRIAPGLRLNIGKRGVSLSAGIRGANLTFGRHGTYGNVGLPGSGLSYRTRLDAPTARSRSSSRGGSRASTPVPAQVDYKLTPDGELHLVDEAGIPLDESTTRRLRPRLNESVREYLEEVAGIIQRDRESLLLLHLHTPSPTDSGPAFTPLPFEGERPPVAPKREVPGFWESLIPGTQDRLRREYEAALANYQEEIAAWDEAARRHEESEATRKETFYGTRRGDVPSMERALEARLGAIEWPRPTTVTYDFEDLGRTLRLDVDLPEMEDIPTTSVRAAARSWKLIEKDLSPTAIRRDYAQHIHSLLFRLVGEAFRLLPTLKAVEVSAYTQRTDAATGRTKDTYLLSLQVDRERWKEIDFSNLEAVDPVQALALFNLRREMNGRFEMKPIHPF